MITENLLIGGYFISQPIYRSAHYGDDLGCLVFLKQGYLCHQFQPAGHQLALESCVGIVGELSPQEYAVAAVVVVAQRAVVGHLNCFAQESHLPPGAHFVHQVGSRQLVDLVAVVHHFEADSRTEAY